MYLKIHTVRSRLTILLPCTVPINCIANCTNVYDRIHLYNSNSVHAFDTRDPCVPRCVMYYYEQRRQRRTPKETEGRIEGTRDRIYERNIDIEKRKRNDDSYYNRIIYVPRNNTGNLPFSIRYFRVSSRLLKNFSPAE